MQIKNWKNFTNVSLDITDRMFLVGPNASGKSNFLDIFRFLKDLTQTGGLQSAIEKRGGISNVRSHSAKGKPDIFLQCTFEDSDKNNWEYTLIVTASQLEGVGTKNVAMVKKEQIKKNQKSIAFQDKDSEEDKEVLRQTLLENLSRNKDFREIYKFFQDITYQHIIPELVRRPSSYADNKTDTSFGSQLLYDVAQCRDKTRQVRFRKIAEALRIALPQLLELSFEFNKSTGEPHLKARYENWRDKGVLQTEESLSDGTLRLFGLLWILLKKDFSLLLLEEPELSLHQGIVRHLPEIFWKIQKGSDRQFFISTHSPDMFADKSIALEDIVLLTPQKEGTATELASSRFDIQHLMAAGISLGESAFKKTMPPNTESLSLFDPV